jgi:two-component system sporulation sensor kinase A
LGPLRKTNILLNLLWVVLYLFIGFVFIIIELITMPFDKAKVWIMTAHFVYFLLGGGYLVWIIKKGGIKEQNQDNTQKLLQSSEKLMITGQLAAGIAHEIRNPLTSLKGFIQLIRSGHEAKKEYYDIMATELDRIELILSELLVLAKPQQGELLKKKDLITLLNQVVILLQTQAIMNNVQLITHFQIEWVYIHCNENQIKQVFINIIKNAIEEMPSGGEILIETENQLGMVLVRIIDQGSGIPEDTISKLGEPFYSTKAKGTGLGLMVSLSILKNHGGGIEIKSKIGEGTTVQVNLPLMG